MSTVKAVNLQHPNSSNINMVLASDGSVSGGFPAGGRNRIINGGFDVWQRGTSFSSAGYTSDRWAIVIASGQTTSVSQQTFIPGSAPVAGYEASTFLRATWSGTPSGYFWLTQRIEDVRSFAGQTVTLSFWAKSSSATSALSPAIEQNFGSGGSGVVTTNGTAISLTTTWQRFSQTFNVPSISGKTIGTSSYLDVRPFQGSSSVNGINIDIWGVQLEAGNSSTPFEVKPYAQELSSCQRYYWRSQNGTNWCSYGFGRASSSTTVYWSINFPQPMRSNPTSVDFSNLAAHWPGVSAYNITSMTLSESNNLSADGSAGVASGLTSGSYYHISNNGTAGGYIGFNAEL